MKCGVGVRCEECLGRVKQLMRAKFTGQDKTNEAKSVILSMWALKAMIGIRHYGEMF